MRKPHYDNVLFQLSDDQQAQLFDWIQTIGYTETIKKVAAPEPDGFGLKTYRVSLHRFYRRYSQTVRQENLAELGELKAQNVPPIPTTDLIDIAEQSIRHLAFELSTGSADLSAFDQVSRWLTKQQYLKLAGQQHALARERLALDREKYQFNAARAALEHHAELGEILKKDDLDSEDKINAARSILWNIPINQLP